MMVDQSSQTFCNLFDFTDVEQARVEIVYTKDTSIEQQTKGF